MHIEIVDSISTAARLLRLTIYPQKLGETCALLFWEQHRGLIYSFTHLQLQPCLLNSFAQNKDIYPLIQSQ